MRRLDGIIDDAEPDGDWIVGEMLLWCREMLNSEIENLLRFRKKVLCRT